MRRRARPTRQRSLALGAAIGGFTLIAALLGGAQAAAAPDDEITVPDAALLACVNSELGRGPTEAVTEAQAATITRLICMNRGVSDLAGIEHLTVLETAIVDSNNISDISPLAALTSLQTLGLGGNQIEDVGALAGLTSLEFLRISSNDVQDVSPLVNLTSLEFLVLSYNTIADISALAGMTSLQSLFLEDNDIEDLSPLSGLTAIEELELSGNRITDVSALADLGPVVAILDITDQLVDLGDLDVGAPRQNPVTGLDGLPVPLDGLYDAATNSFTPVTGGPIALTWATDDDRFSGTLTFDLVEGDDTDDDETDTDDPVDELETGDELDPGPEVDDDAETDPDDGGDDGKGSTDSGSNRRHIDSEPTTRGTSMLPATGASPLTTSLLALGAMLLLTGATTIAWTRHSVRTPTRRGMS